MTEQATVLIVEPSTEDRATYRSYLAEDNTDYLILEASSGAAGLALCRELQPSCVVIDYLLPDINGVEFMRALSQADGAPTVQVVFLSSVESIAAAVEAMKLGAYDYLIKGATSPESLRFAIRDAIEKAARQRQVLAQHQALQRKQERFCTSAENLLDCFGIYTAIRDQAGQIVDFRIDYVNEKACQNNAMTRQEQIGRGLCELLPAHRSNGLFDEYCRVVETGEPLIKESLSYTDVYAGSWVERAFDIRASKLGDGFIAIWRDVTAQKHAEERLRFLAQLSLVLADSPDYAMALHQFVRMIVPTLADLCAIDTLTAEGKVQRVALASADPTTERLARELWERYPPTEQMMAAVVTTLRNQQPLLIASIPSDHADTIAQDAEHARLLHAIGLRSSLTVPLIAHGRILGALSLGITTSPHHYTTNDLEFARELARRAALALDHARLYQQFQETLRKREEVSSLLNALLMSAPVGFTFLDRELRYQLINDQLAAINGQPVAAHLGRTVREMVPGLADHVEPIFQRVIETGEPHLNLELSGETAAAPGQKRFWHENIYPVTSTDGRIIGIGVVVQEITERKRAEEQVRFQARLLDAVGQAVIATKPDGTIIYWNRAATELYGWTVEEALGRNAMDLLVNETTWVQAAEIMAALRNGQSWKGEFLSRCRDGRLIPTIVTDSPIYDEEGTLIGIIGVSTDISERKHAEAERLLLLEREQQARTAAEAAVKMRDQFLSIASHELKTPLTALLGNAQFLQRRAAQGATLSERDQQRLAIITEQTMRFSRMIDMLLDVSHIELRRITINCMPVDILQLVERLVHEIQQTVVQHTITCDTPTAPLVVEGDELRLGQVVQNLLQNAIKYSPSGGTIAIRVAQQATMVTIAVSDQGIGIPADELPHLFSQFYRAQNVKKQHIVGMGIGLYVVKELVTLHGGTIDVVSTEGEGSTFTISLPLLT